MSSKVVTPALVQRIRDQFVLDWEGIHGAAHWSRVHATGLRLAQDNGAIVRVVELFAFLHDSKRHNDGHDPEHGERAAAWAEELAGEAFEIAPRELALLQLACRGHSGGAVHDDVTVQTCWDADRLDLGRVGIRAHPHYLSPSTAANRDLITWAYERSLGLSR